MRDVAQPSRPWAGRMRWCDLAFLHWPVAPNALRPLIPPGLAIETFDGDAWLGIVPFRMEGVRVRGTPPLPTVHAFPEINVRTYVRGAGRVGVWFFSLDATSRLAVRGARWLYNLPYFDADIDATREVDSAGHETIRYTSRRVHRAAPSAGFAASYSAKGDPCEAVPGTLDHFLAERYCLFMYDDRRELGLLDVDHAPWTLRRGRADIRVNSMAAAAGIQLPDIAPIVHIGDDLDVRAWARLPI
jgi:uncharacterized protein